LPYFFNFNRDKAIRGSSLLNVITKTPMTILSIESIINEDLSSIIKDDPDFETLTTVTAVLEDARVTHQQTMESPEEYGPGLCKTSFWLNEGEILPTDETELIGFLSEMHLSWEPITVSDY
jgi:hypothetical protein